MNMCLNTFVLSLDYIHQVLKKITYLIMEQTTLKMHNIDNTVLMLDAK